VASLEAEYKEERDQFIEAVKIYDYGATRPLTAIRAMPGGATSG
jgi:hypothetical protein